MAAAVPVSELPEDFYSKIKPRLHARVGRELRLAGTVVDIGCGPCDLVRYLAQTYRQKVTGVDVSPAGFPRVRHTPDGSHYRCRPVDGMHFDFARDESTDAVVSMWAFHEIEKPAAVLAEALRILRPGGVILVVDFPRDSLAQRLWNEDYYTPEQIAARLEQAGFDEVRARRTARGQIAWVKGWKPAGA